MLHQVLDLLIILLRQTVARGVRDIYHCGPGLDHSLHHLGEVFIVRASGILAIKLHIVHKPLGVLCGGDGLFEDMLTVGVKLIQDMLVAGADTRMDTLVLGILQGLEGHVDVVLHSACQCTNHRPCHRLRNLNHRMEVTRTRYGESRLNHVHAELFQGFRHLDFLYRVQLASRYLFTVPERRVEDVQSVVHFSFSFSYLVFIVLLSVTMKKPFTLGSEKGSISFRLLTPY